MTRDGFRLLSRQITPVLIHKIQFSFERKENRFPDKLFYVKGESCLDPQ